MNCVLLLNFRNRLSPGNSPLALIKAKPEEELRIPSLGPNSSVSTVGLDEVTFGLTVSQAEREAGTAMIPCEPVSECYRVTPQVAPEGISFLVHEGTIERVDIVAGPIETTSGLGIGTSSERLVELFGDRIEREVLGTDTVDLSSVHAGTGATGTDTPSDASVNVPPAGVPVAAAVLSTEPASTSA